MRRSFALAAMLAAACAGEVSDEPPAADPFLSPTEIGPRDFAAVACPGQPAWRDCLLVVAGGKRLLFGAPAGAVEGWTEADLSLLDGVFLFRLRAEDLEGLDEVRNATWRAGRQRALPVAGPLGVGDVVDGLNRAFASADALQMIDAPPAGGFDAALLAAREAVDARTVFDTGDLVVAGRPDGPARTRYQITYAGVNATLGACAPGAGDPDSPLRCDADGRWLDGQAMTMIVDR